MAEPDADAFKVTDRRRRPEEAAPAEPTSGPRARTSGSAGTADPFVAAAPRQPGDRTLTGLFIMLASSAVTAMGDRPDLSGQAPRDLEQATELIDLLILLREKTEGHRTAEETHVLEQIVYDLQLRYVAATKKS